MREILVLQLGGFGNRMGEKFWQELQKDSNFKSEDGKLGQLQVTENNVYYNLNETQPLPRCVQVDLGQEIPISNLNFNPCNQFSFNYSSGNNYAFVKYNCASEIQDIIMDSIRSEVEVCDSFQGFQFFHSIIGGAGSGLSSILSQAINDEYGQKLIQSNLLAPSIKLNDSCVVAPYNAILSFHSFFSQIQQIILFDNEGLESNLKRLGEKYYEFDDINTLIAQTICCNSSPFRRAGDVNSSLQKLINNLIPYPRMSLNTCAVTNNQFSDYFRQYLKMNESQVLKEIMSNNHNLNSNDLSKGKLITAALSLRGNISNEVIDREKFQLEMFYQYHRNYHSDNRRTRKLEWLNLFFTNICKKQYSNYEYFGSSILNSTTIIQSLKSVCDKFEKMIIKKTFMHKYCQEGIEQSEFDDAKACITDLISEYENLGENSNCIENRENWQ